MHIHVGVYHYEYLSVEIGRNANLSLETRKSIYFNELLIKNLVVCYLHVTVTRSDVFNNVNLGYIFTTEKFGFLIVNGKGEKKSLGSKFAGVWDCWESFTYHDF